MPALRAFTSHNVRLTPASGASRLASTPWLSSSSFRTVPPVRCDTRVRKSPGCACSTRPPTPTQIHCCQWAVCTLSLSTWAQCRVHAVCVPPIPMPHTPPPLKHDKAMHQQEAQSAEKHTTAMSRSTTGWWEHDSVPRHPPPPSPLSTRLPCTCSSPGFGQVLGEAAATAAGSTSTPHQRCRLVQECRGHQTESCMGRSRQCSLSVKTTQRHVTRINMADSLPV